MNIKLIFLSLMTISCIHAVDENWYMGGQSYYNFGSSYYPKWNNNVYWGGDGWIFKTGYKAPTQRCCRRVKCTRACTRLRPVKQASADRLSCRGYRKSLPIEKNNTCCSNRACSCP